MSLGQRLLWVLIWFDRVVNWVLGGDIMHTISGRVGYNSRYHKNWFWSNSESFIDWLFFWDPNHCRDAMMWEYKNGWRTLPYAKSPNQRNGSPTKVNPRLIKRKLMS